MGPRPERCVWHHVDHLPLSRLHREWVDVVASAALRFRYEGVRTDITEGRLSTPAGHHPVSVFTLSAPNAAVVRSMVEELPSLCGGNGCAPRLVESDPGMLRLLRSSVPDIDVAAVEALSLELELEALLGGAVDHADPEGA